MVFRDHSLRRLLMGSLADKRLEECGTREGKQEVEALLRLGIPASKITVSRNQANYCDDDIVTITPVYEDDGWGEPY